MSKCAIPMQPCSSSQLKEFGYDATTRTLGIRFHQKKGPAVAYTYPNVPPELHERMRAADEDPEQSVGKFFGEHIRSAKDDEGNPKFPSTKIVEEEAEA